MFKIKSRRKIKNAIVSPNALLRLSIPFFVLIVIAITVILLIHREILQSLNTAEVIDRANPIMLANLQQIVMTVTKTGLIGIMTLGIACLGLWVVYSHRIFGPTVPIRRHIQNLIKGDYQSRIHLRAGDEFKDIAAELNELAEKL